MIAERTYQREKDSDCREPGWPLGLYRRGDSFRFRRMVGGEVAVQAWGDIPLADAIRKAQRFNLEIEDGRNPVMKAKQDATTFPAFAAEWLSLKTANLRRKSLIRYRAMVDNFTRFIVESRGKAEITLSSLSMADASAYVQWRAMTPVMPNGHSNLTKAVHQGAARKTIHSEVATLRQLFKVAVRRKLMPENPFDEVKVHKPKTHEVAAKHHPLNEAEEAALLKAAGEIDVQRQYGEGSLHDIFLFLMKTGLREAEIRNLEWSDILWDQGLIRIRDKAVVETRTVDIPNSAVSDLKRLINGRSPDAPLFKNDEEMAQFNCVLAIRERVCLGAIRVGDVDLESRKIVATRRFEWRPKATQGDIPMCETVRQMLTRLQAGRKSNFVFAHKDGGSCRLQLWEMVKEAQKRAKIPGNLRLHDLRHTFAVRLRQRGTPLEVIMGLMRHSDIRETLIYAPYNLDEGRAAIQVLDR